MVTSAGWGVSPWASVAWSAGVEDVVIIITDAHKFAAFGTLLLRGNGGAPETFVLVGGVKDIPGPEQISRTVDVTVYDSPGGFEEVIPVLLGTSPMAIELVYDPAASQHIGLLNDKDTKVLRNFRIVETDTAATVTNFAAYVLGFSPAHPADGALIANVILQPVGPI